MPKCTINGKEVEVKQGATIIEAFQQDKESIAHYCWHPALSIAGVCRLCMVEVEGNPRLQIACNTVVTEGMKVNNTSAKVKESVKWGLDFHLINHPLDCPICDQAGECGLQDQYMQYGKYDPEMAEKKVKKHKVVDLGPKIVLDTERCILCSRCVRFTDEVSKTGELGIFNRGDRAEVGTFANKPLDNNYSVNVVDICPVGALTSRDFRFQQRVWLLKEANTICNGCSTGCSVKVSYNKEGLFRVKPRHNEEVNGYWMCDKGREIYKYVNRDVRLLDARVATNGNVEWLLPTLVVKKQGEALRTQAKSDAQSVALVLTGQYTTEEYEALISFWKNELGSSQIFHWINDPQNMSSFDGLLLRGDRNPNTAGLKQVLQKHGIQTEIKALSEALQRGSINTLVVAGPENQTVYSDMSQRIPEFSKAKNLVWLTSCKNEQLDKLAGAVTQVPMKSFFEKEGSFINHAGLKQDIAVGMTVSANALTLREVASLLSGKETNPFEPKKMSSSRVDNEFTLKRGAL